MHRVGTKYTRSSLAIEIRIQDMLDKHYRNGGIDVALDEQGDKEVEAWVKKSPKGLDALR